MKCPVYKEQQAQSYKLLKLSEIAVRANCSLSVFSAAMHNHCLPQKDESKLQPLLSNFAHTPRRFWKPIRNNIAVHSIHLAG